MIESIDKRYPLDRWYEKNIRKRYANGDKIPWWHVRQHELSESFLREFKDELHWSGIIGVQTNLSKDFLREFRDEIYEEVDWELEAPSYDEQFLDAVDELLKGL